MASTSEQYFNFSSLKKAIDDKNETQVNQELETIISAKNPVSINEIGPFENLLKTENVQTLRNTSKCIAELAKSLNNRNKLAEKDIIIILLKLLSKDDVLCQIQACRALGNLCYENDSVRNILFDNEALQQIVAALNTNILKEGLEKSLDQVENDRNFRKVACGLLFNFLASNEDIQKQALDMEILNVIEKILNIESSNIDMAEDCITHLLLILTLLLDNGGDAWINESICQCLIGILEKSTNPDVSELCLEILLGQAENDEIKMHLAKHGLCELMYELLEKHKQLVHDEDSRALMKMVCNLIVLVLTGDDSMMYLYANGKGQVYKNMISWLESTDEDLQTTGVLAIGNFARKDCNCIKMVEDGIAKKLLNILANKKMPDNEIKLHHAVLSALRNLAIPAQNKTVLLNEGIVDILTPLLNCDQMPVVFKLLGTLRMIIHMQEKTALKLASEKYFIERIVHWCYSTDHLGVKGESSRFLAWLIKHSHSPEACRNILTVPNSVKCLIDMIPSQHAVMQNEALLALNLLILNHSEKNVQINDNETECDKKTKTTQVDQKETTTTTNVDNIERILIDANLGPNLSTLLAKYGTSMEKEVVENLLVFLHQIIKYETIRQYLSENKIGQELSTLLTNGNLTGRTDDINKLISKINTNN